MEIETSKIFPENIPSQLKSESFMLWRYEKRDAKMKNHLSIHIQGLEGMLLTQVNGQIMKLLSVPINQVSTGAME